ncbi:hypothetical protein [Stenotrophomonas sp.]|uniref:hypothetical protein n=1 Tax=Stenotrophomonas sp. TaxID=69392 RepID=UPI00289EBB1A|nr:hypothetical protein [Stenotrophomonas sp.]
MRFARRIWKVNSELEIAPEVGTCIQNGLQVALPAERMVKVNGAVEVPGEGDACTVRGYMQLLA